MINNLSEANSYKEITKDPKILPKTIIGGGGCTNFMSGTTLYHIAASGNVYVDYNVAWFSGDCATKWLYTMHTNGQGHWHYCP
jgi:hypothetical protein